MKTHKIILGILVAYSVIVTFLLYNNGLYSGELFSQNESETSLYFDNIKKNKFNEQSFWGKWKIVECIYTDYATPLRHSGIDENGEVKGKDHNNLINLEIEITPKHIECQGDVYPYDENYMPETYVLYVKSKNGTRDNQIDNVAYYYKDETLGFSSMEYVPYMFFALSQNINLTKEIDYSDNYNIWDLNGVYLKDSNTAYIGDDTQLFLMKKIEE